MIADPQKAAARSAESRMPPRVAISWFTWSKALAEAARQRWYCSPAIRLPGTVFVPLQYRDNRIVHLIRTMGVAAACQARLSLLKDVIGSRVISRTIAAIWCGTV